MEDAVNDMPEEKNNYLQTRKKIECNHSIQKEHQLVLGYDSLMIKHYRDVK